MIVSDARRRLASSHVSALTVLALLASRGVTAEPDYKPLAGDQPAVAGAFGNLDASLRRFAILKDTDPQALRVSLLLDGEAEPRALPLAPNAEVWHAGWWGRLDQLVVGDRVWVWLHVDGNTQPDAVWLVADELSEQDLYAPVEIIAVTAPGTDQGVLTIKSAKGSKATERTVTLAKAELYRGDVRAPCDSLQPGEKVYVQTTGDAARLILDAAAFETRRAERRFLLRKRWTDEGLPGTLIFSHPQTSEVELMLDHEAMRWGRSLQPGDKVTLQAVTPVPAVVRKLRPWRERTQLLLSVDDRDQSALAVGQRVTLQAPPREADDNTAGGIEALSRSTPEHVEWLASGIYCPCLMHDDCAGHFLTLAACNIGPVKPCGMAKRIREQLAEMVDRGLTDQQILEQLGEEHGPKLLRPHMLP
jgi:hypothetical protein